MQKLLRLGAMLALGAALVLPAWKAEARTVDARAKYNFSAGRAILSGKLPLKTRKAAAKNTKRRVRKARRVAGARRGAGYAACKAAARKFGVSLPTALAVCRLESGFRCSAVGRAGELGLLQIKLATARALGYRGSRRGLLNCSTGAYWGMKHLAQAIRRGGVWKHNAGLYAKRPNAQARKYARLVAALRRHYR